MENLKKSKSELLEHFYYSLDSLVSFGSSKKLFKEVKKVDKTISRSEVNQWLQSQLTYTLHKPVKLNFKTRRFVVFDIDEQWQMDLVDLSKFSRYNAGFKYLLVCMQICMD